LKRDARKLEEELSLEMLTQPDDSTCGPTCLQAVYAYYGDEVDLHRLIAETERLDGGGTLAVMLAVHALERGYGTRIYTFNLQVFDPTWFGSVEIDLTERLEKQQQHTADPKVRLASQWYLRYLELGGEVVLQDLTARRVREYLRKGVPILTGLSGTYLYRAMRERLLADESLVDDDIGGSPQGHFVVLCGYHQEDRTVLVADPMNDNPVSETRRYEVNIDRLMNAILLGILTQDANLLVIQPRLGGEGPDAHPVRSRQPG
jgi:hypothetical protein